MFEFIKKLIALTFFILIIAALFVSLSNFYGLRSKDKIVNKAISKAKSIAKLEEKPQIEGEKTEKPKPVVLLKFALVADSHSDLKNLEAALTKIKNEKVDFIIGLGDYSDVGTREELQSAKNLFDKAGITYELIPGDHDLWDSRDKGFPDSAFNFRYIFGKAYQSFEKNKVKFILINNADNYQGLDTTQMTWFKNEIMNIDSSVKLTFLFAHEPLFNPTSAHIMGRLDKKVDDQRREILNLLNQNKVNEVFSGDIHFFSRYEDSQSRVKITTIGSVTTERNWQGPRFAVVSVFEDYTYDVKDESI